MSASVFVIIAVAKLRHQTHRNAILLVGNEPAAIDIRGLSNDGFIQAFEKQSSRLAPRA
jgi:hypothetical protein